MNSQDDTTRAAGLPDEEVEGHAIKVHGVREDEEVEGHAIKVHGVREDDDVEGHAARSGH